MKKFTHFIAIIVLLFSLIPLSPIEAQASAQDWKNYDVRTELKGLKAKDIDDYIKSKGHGDKALKDIGKVIIDVSENTGLNPGVLLGMIIVETGWGTSRLATEFNNFGGVMCKKGYECRYSKDRYWTVFKHRDESIRIQAELLMGKTYVKAGKTTIEQVLLTYAPPNDGNDLYSSGGYMDMIGRTISALGYDSKSGSKIAPKNGTYKNEDGSDSGKKKGYYEQQQFFIQPQYNQNANTGIDKNGNIVPSELSYALSVFSAQTVKILTYIGVILSLILLTYMSIVLILYIAIFRGHSFNFEALNKLTKFSDEDNVYSRKTFFKMMGIVAFCLIMIGIFLMSYHVTIIAMIYEGIQTVFEFLT